LLEISRKGEGLLVGEKRPGVMEGKKWQVEVRDVPVSQEYP